jgi:hypothetical protein
MAGRVPSRLAAAGPRQSTSREHVSFRVSIFVISGLDTTLFHAISQFTERRHCEET